MFKGSLVTVAPHNFQTIFTMGFAKSKAQPKLGVDVLRSYGMELELHCALAVLLSRFLLCIFCGHVESALLAPPGDKTENSYWTGCILPTACWWWCTASPLYTFKCVCRSVHVRTDLAARTCTCARTNTHTHIHTCTYTHTHTHTHTRTHIHMHKHMQVQSRGQDTHTHTSGAPTFDVQT